MRTIVSNDFYAVILPDTNAAATTVSTWSSQEIQRIVRVSRAQVDTDRTFEYFIHSVLRRLEEDGRGR
jgi:hypothetical protein